MRDHHRLGRAGRARGVLKERDIVAGGLHLGCDRVARRGVCAQPSDPRRPPGHRGPGQEGLERAELGRDVVGSVGQHHPGPGVVDKLVEVQQVLGQRARIRRIHRDRDGPGQHAAPEPARKVQPGRIAQDHPVPFLHARLRKQYQHGCWVDGQADMRIKSSRTRPKGPPFAAPGKG